jgi:formylglycine-generating enzyme required for sulfatase activity
MPLSWLLNALPAVPFRNVVLTALCYLLMLPWCVGNDIRIANVVLINQNLPGGFSNVQFDLSWKNSWRYDFNSGINNWDAAWVFVKFKAGATNPTFTGITLTNGSALVNLPSTAGLRVGMPVRVTAGISPIPAGTVIASINSATQITLSANSTTTSSNNQLEFQRIWEHARLHNTGQDFGTGFTADPGLLTPGAAWDASSNPALGFMIYREAEGYGNVGLTSVQLRWNYAENGLASTALVEVQVFAIEMVYVPQGSFFLGSGGTEGGSFTDGARSSGATIPYLVTSENALTIAASAGNLWGTSLSGDNTIGGSGTLSASYPKGFASFYCMKYEISQGQYRDFLNTLTYSQQLSRTAAAPNTVIGTAALSNTNRNALKIKTPGVSTMIPAVYGTDLDGNNLFDGTGDGEWIAMNFINWPDDAAYSDWAGLRPMTELEFEKANRGFQHPVANSFVWGTEAATAANNITNGGTDGEFSNTAGANIVFLTQANVQGPLRVGAFAGAVTSRAQAGASFWGIMEMSGNLSERAVTIGNLAGRSYTGAHGDGALLSNGTANVNYWPGINGNNNPIIANTVFGGSIGITQSVGTGYRGGGWSSDIARLYISARNASSFLSETRGGNDGFRAVRSAGCTFSASAPTFDTSNGLSPNVAALGSTLVYKVNETGNFIWIIPAGWEIVSGQGTNQIELQINSLPGTIRVGAVNECGASSLTTLIIN